VLSDLSLTVVGSTNYAGVLSIVAKDSVAAEGIQFDFGGGATTTYTSFQAGAMAYGATAPTAGTVTVTSNTSAMNWTSTGGTVDMTFRIHVAMQIGTGGTIVPRFAQNSHSSGTATVEKNSYFILWKTSN
jgi:hypothetical protein